MYSLMTSDLVNSKPIIWCWFWGVCRMMVDNLDVYNVQCCEVGHFYWVYYLVSSSSDVTLLLDFCRMPLSRSGNLLQSL